MTIRISEGLTLALAVTLVSGLAGEAAAQIASRPGAPTPEQEEAPLPPEPSVEARIWLDRGADPVVQRGDRVRVYYRTSEGAYVSIFHVDTNGTVSLVFPQTPESRYFVEGGRDYRLLFPPNSSWFVEDDPGVGYFFILASPDPMEFGDFPYSWQSRSWDLSFVGQAVYEDPFVAMDEYIARLIPDWEYADYTLDWVEYNVGERHDYPRFLCYDCHGFTPYTTWNPYLSACTSFRVVIYDDPWYYPVNRYRGNAVVYVRPAIWRQPRFAFKERVVGEPWSPLVRPRPAPGGPGLPGSAAPRRTGAGIGTGGTARVYPAPRRSGGAEVAAPARPGARARPSQVRDRRTTTGRVLGTPRTTLERRGTAGSGKPATGAVRPRTTRPGATPDRSGTSTRPGAPRRPTGRVVVPGKTRGSATSGTRPGRPGVVRPSRPSAGSGGRPPARVNPRARSGGSSGRVIQVRPRRPGSGGSVQRRPARPSRSSGAARRAPTRSTRGGAVRRAPARPSRGSGAVRRAPTRSSRGGSVRRSPPARVRSSGGGAQRRSPPRRSPPRRRSGGGGAPSL